jgi:hypothetical protein
LRNGIPGNNNTVMQVTQRDHNAWYDIKMSCNCESFGMKNTTYIRICHEHFFWRKKAGYGHEHVAQMGKLSKKYGITYCSINTYHLEFSQTNRN